MNTAEIKIIFDHINNDLLGDIQIKNGNSLFEQYALLHDLGTSCLYEIEINKDKIQHLTDLFKKYYTDQYEIDCYYFTENKIKQEITKIDQLGTFLDKKERVYLLFHPVEDAISVIEFQELIAHLRAPEGCPWDKEQTHLTLRTNLLEEAYEVIEAIDAQDSAHLREELGDLLLQIVLHTQIALENKEFSMSDVVHDIHTKIIRRHPHVFGTTIVEDGTDVLKNWEKIKEGERQSDGSQIKKSLLTSIPKNLPSLSTAQKYQERVARVGFDWEEIGSVYEKISEEIQEVISATKEKEIEEELGDLLFAVVNLVRWKGFDAESALRMTNKKFLKRFSFIEKKISQSGQFITNVSLSEMDALWEQAKLED